MSFRNSFTSGTPVRVFVSVNHGNESFEVHSTTLVWVEDVSPSRLRACVVRGDPGSNGTSPLIGLHSKVRSQELNTAKPDLPYLPLVQNVKKSRSIR